MGGQPLMRLLLDTHIWLWSLAAPERLTERVIGALSDSSNELWLSPVSVWEVLVLARKKRILLSESPEKWVRSAFTKTGFREAPLNFEVALQSEKLRLLHADPADRFIAATAIVYDLTLVTSDRHLIRSRQFSVLPN
jgi:PIN domain nuclease of toxin-antitoxin system